ncbi:glycosyltransferase family 2 protein [Bacillus sp. JJ783]|uniref:glycosyltransferase family 2 protein n=1 Tax=Bacillus sp. JJ783 TaxID=3122974 RepID=UPI0030023539
MKISLIMATINREKEIEEFILSLIEQTYENYELIIVDQNSHDNLGKLIEKYKERVSIVYLKSTPGLSKSRNVGLNVATGDIIGFPDDDCTYDASTLEKVIGFFKQNNDYSIFTGQCQDKDGQIVAGKFSNNHCNLDKGNVWECGVSVTLFLKKELLKKVKGFDEELGVGSGTVYGSGEETDFLLRCLEAGGKGMYDPSFIVYHPNPVLEYNDKSFKRAYLYGAGYGRVLKKHKYSIGKKTNCIIRPFIAIFIYVFNIKKSTYYYYSLKGRAKGLFSG